MKETWDFSGWVTRNDLVCSDGRTIRKDAFKHNDGQKVPLVWNHNHSEPENVLGYVLLNNRDEGVYGYGKFNNSEQANTCKELVCHGDVQSLSIYANQLKQDGSNVLHGTIREVSLVLAGANPGAFIDSVMMHSDEGTDEEKGIIVGYDERIVLYHADGLKDDLKDMSKNDESETKDGQNKEEVSEKENETIKDVFDTLSEKQKNAVYALVGLALEEQKVGAEIKQSDIDEEDEKDMKHNIFENDSQQDDVLVHTAMETIMKDAKRLGSVKESFLEHSAEYGIENLEYLFPDNKNTDNTPIMIARDQSWVSKIMGGVNHTPFSRVKTLFADITEDQARAKGYIKGKLKKDEVFSLLRRATDPTTVYKKQKMDRDDVIDITDFDTIAWLKKEMRIMLDEELARAFLIGDGRLSSDEEKIDETRIRPIVNDHDLFVIRWSVADGSTAEEKTKNFITAAIKARKNYKGSGRPILFTTEEWLTDMLLLEDSIGHALYKTEAELATKLRVSEIVTVPVMEGLTDKDSKAVYGIIVNPRDYTVGADKGGAINMFDDFDIDYNQMKYLIETRCSGALRLPFSAIVLRYGSTTASEEPSMATIKSTLNA